MALPLLAIGTSYSALELGFSSSSSGSSSAVPVNKGARVVVTIKDIFADTAVIVYASCDTTTCGDVCVLDPFQSHRDNPDASPSKGMAAIGERLAREKMTGCRKGEKIALA